MSLIEDTELPGVLLITPKAFPDSRGFFVEMFRASEYAERGVLPIKQLNHSRSGRGALRGLHLQNPTAQGKLVWVTRGSVIDVAVDVRVGSPHFGKWMSRELNDSNHCQLWVPPGFAHGFVVNSDEADFFYACSDYYAPDDQLGIAWNDPEIGIDWGIGNPELSGRDAEAPCLADLAGRGVLPQYSD
ncbi:MAG: dTDP-4-dehydrorhamnose 3,5-epimerase [Hyphomicrobiaceae bacterium]